MADNEPGLADVIVGAATSIPTPDSSRRNTKGIMAQQRLRLDQADFSYDLPNYISDFISTVRNEPATMDYLKDTVT